jgi:hypothetical protein
MRRALATLLFLGAISGCALQGSPSTPAQIKASLDSLGLTCERLDVRAESDSNLEIMSCGDGTVGDSSYEFWIWQSKESRNKGLEEICSGSWTKEESLREIVSTATVIARSGSLLVGLDELLEVMDGEASNFLSICNEAGYSLALKTDDAAIEVPSLVGQLFSDASESLELSGLLVLRVFESSAEPEGIVIRQEPNPQTQVLPGTAVTLFVSSGN